MFKCCCVLTVTNLIIFITLIMCHKEGKSDFVTYAIGKTLDFGKTLQASMISIFVIFHLQMRNLYVFKIHI